MKIFNLDLKKYALSLIPPFLRDNLFFAFVLAFLSPLIDLFNAFLDNRDQNLLKLRFNYQTASLEYRLNDALDPSLRRIKISKSVLYKSLFVYTKAEIDPNNPNYYSDNENNKMKWLNNDKPLYIRNKAELTSDFDFVVLIPFGADINEIKLRAEVDFYILPSKQYKIETYQP